MYGRVCVAGFGGGVNNFAHFVILWEARSFEYMPQIPSVFQCSGRDVLSPLSRIFGAHLDRAMEGERGP